MKNGVNDLAIFGGMPAFEEQLHVGRPNIGDRQRLLKRLNDMLDRRWLTNNGPFVKELEDGIAQMHGVKHCIAVCNATIGLELAVRALGMVGEVIIPSMTFVATAHALQWQAIKPVFCDVDPQTYTIDPGKIEDLITPRTTGIIGVHLFGRSCDVDALADIARRHNLKLLYDAAHAIGCSHKGVMIGNFGDAEVFSFHATKMFNSSEGGAITTNNDDLAMMLRLMRNFGFAGNDNVIYIGINGKMNEMSAAMGLTSLECFDDFVRANHQNYKQYQREMAGIPGVALIAYDETAKMNYQYIVLEIDEAEVRVSRDQIATILSMENVLARRYFYPGCHRMEPYRTLYPDSGACLPETERLSERMLALPTGTSIGPEEIRRICQLIRFIVANGGEISKRLAEYHVPKQILPSSMLNSNPQNDLTLPQDVA